MIQQAWKTIWVLGVLTFSMMVNAQANEADTAESYELPQITVSQEPASTYTELPPRDLYQRPYTQIVGLETATSVVGQDEIRQQNAFSIVDAMKYLPGAWVESRGQKVKKFFSVRGQRYPYPGYTVDGAWFREFHETNYFMSAANVDSIELVRSSSAFLLGPGGMTGMVNIKPRTFQQKHTENFTSFGTHDSFRNDLVHGDTIGRLSYAVGAGYYHTDGPRGENARENVTNLYGRFAYDVSDDLTLSLTSYGFFGDRQQQTAEAPAAPALQNRIAGYDPMSSYLLVGRAHLHPSDEASTDITVNYREQRLEGYQSGTADWLEKDHEYGAGLVQTLQLTPEDVMRFGGMFNIWKSPTGKRFYVGNPGELRTYSGFILNQHTFGRLVVEGGYRLSRTYYDQFGGLNVEGSPSGGLKGVEIVDEWEDPLHTLTLGGAYELDDLHGLFANVSWGQIAAAPGMLDTNLEKPGTEKRTKVDIGIRRDLEAIGTATATGFYVWQDDAALLSSSTVTVNGEPFGLYSNEEAKSYGIELELRSIRLDNGLQFFANAVVMKTKRTQNGSWEQDREVPDVIINGGASLVMQDVEFAIFGNHVSDYKDNRFLSAGADPRVLGDFLQVDAQVTYNFGKDKSNSLFFRVDNVGDKTYSTVNGYPTEGRSFWSGVRLVF